VSDENFEQRLREEIELARALTAVLLAARLEVAEIKAQDAYEKVASGAAHAHGN
jgi:hypothetical protein